MFYESLLRAGKIGQLARTFGDETFQVLLVELKRGFSLFLRGGNLLGLKDFRLELILHFDEAL